MDKYWKYVITPQTYILKCEVTIHISVSLVGPIINPYSLKIYIISLYVAKYAVGTMNYHIYIRVHNWFHVFVFLLD